MSTSDGQSIVRSYVDQISALSSGSDFVVLPEGGFAAADDGSLPRLVEPMSQVAAARGV